MILALAIGYATYLPATEAARLPAGIRANSVAAGIMTAIAKGCVPHVAGKEPMAGVGLESKAHAPSRVLQASDGVVPSGWGKPAYLKAPTRIGDVWIAAFPNGNCLVHAWGDALTPMRSAVHEQFEHDGSPWDATGIGHYKLTLDEGPRKGLTIEARADGETVDRPEIEAEEIITFTVKHGA